jgi:UDP-hydrolysing UDP-N-acetyl-D-glucosamine 2-epimerase
LNKIYIFNDLNNFIFAFSIIKTVIRKHQTLLSRKDLEKFLNFKFSEKKLLLTFHPENLPEEYIVNHINELLAALNNFNHVSLIFTLPNSDFGSKLISQKIIDFVANHSNSRVYSSLGRMGYLSCLANVDGVVGNSSSGILEAPFFNVPTINIGDRQKGRVQPNTVINASPECDEISAAIEKVLIMGKKPPLLSNSINPYGDGSASQKILAILKRTILKKINSKLFYDLDFNKGSINGN